MKTRPFVWVTLCAHGWVALTGMLWCDDSIESNSVAKWWLEKVFGQRSGSAAQRSGINLWLVLIVGWMCWQERTHKARPLFSFKTGWRPRACAAGPHRLYHAATPDKTRHSDPEPCTVTLSHTRTPTHTATATDTHGVQYVKCERDGNGFCLTPDCFVTDKCVTRAKGRSLSSRQNAELLRHIQKPPWANKPAADTDRADKDARWRCPCRETDTVLTIWSVIIGDILSNHQVSLPVCWALYSALTHALLPLPRGSRAGSVVL